MSYINLSDYEGHILRDKDGYGLLFIARDDTIHKYRLVSISYMHSHFTGDNGKIYSDSEGGIKRRIEEGEDTGLTVKDLGVALEKLL